MVFLLCMDRRILGFSIFSVGCNFQVSSTSGSTLEFCVSECVSQWGQCIYYILMITLFEITALEKYMESPK